MPARASASASGPRRRDPGPALPRPSLQPERLRRGPARENADAPPGPARAPGHVGHGASLAAAPERPRPRRQATRGVSAEQRHLGAAEQRGTLPGGTRRRAIAIEQRSGPRHPVGAGHDRRRQHRDRRRRAEAFHPPRASRLEHREFAAVQTAQRRIHRHRIVGVRSRSCGERRLLGPLRQLAERRGELIAHRPVRVGQRAS